MEKRKLIIEGFPLDIKIKAKTNLPDFNVIIQDVIITNDNISNEYIEENVEGIIIEENI